MGDARVDSAVPPFALSSSGLRLPGDGLLQTGNRLEELEGSENQPIVAPVIRDGLAQANIVETPGLRDCECLHSHPDLGHYRWFDWSSYRQA
jgi:hypothetical protein